MDYLHGGKSKKILSEASNDSVKPTSEWKANADGSIPCPQKDRQGCGGGPLELRCMMSENFAMELVKKAEELADSCKLNDMPDPLHQCLCLSGSGTCELSNNAVRKASSRENSDDNYLYCPIASKIQNDDLEHFRWHWGRGEPVIVSNVLETTQGLSWEPLVMWRACRQITNTNHSKHLDVEAIDCLDWCEV